MQIKKSFSEYKDKFYENCNFNTNFDFNLFIQKIEIIKMNVKQNNNISKDNLKIINENLEYIKKQIEEKKVLLALGALFVFYGFLADNNQLGGTLYMDIMEFIQDFYNHLINYGKEIKNTISFKFIEK